MSAETLSIPFDVAEDRIRNWLNHDATIEEIARIYSQYLIEGPVTVYVPSGESVTYDDGVKQ